METDVTSARANSCAPDPRATAIRPGNVLDVGYSFYLADHARSGSLLKESALKVARHFNKLADSFDPGSDEGMYFMSLTSIINSLARGITRRKETLQQRIAAAKQEKDGMIQRISQTETLGGLIKGGVQLIIFSGFAFFLGSMILSGDSMPDRISQDNSMTASFAFTLGMIILGSSLKYWLTHKRILHVFDAYEISLTEANNEYAEAALAEYWLAKENAAAAWKNLTGYDPPELPGYDEVVTRMLASKEERLERLTQRKQRFLFIGRAQRIFKLYKNRKMPTEISRRRVAAPPENPPRETPKREGP